MFIIALFTIAKIWKKPVSIGGWMDKEDVEYIYNRMLRSPWKEENLAICNNMDGPWGYCAKWNQSDRERQILYDLTYMWNLKKNKNKKTELIRAAENRLVVARGRV